LQALRAATIEPATLLACRPQRIDEKGKFADIINGARDPTRDITALRSIQFVMKGGKVYRNDRRGGKTTPSAAAPEIKY